MMTETTMESTYRPLGFVEACARQFRLLWTSKRPLLMMVALLAVLILAGPPWNDTPTMRLLTSWPLWMVLFGPIWAFVVFHNEGPSSRLYHWSLPVGRTKHTFARVAAGAAWLWVLLLALVVAGALMGLVDGNVQQLGELTPAAWINVFTGPLLGFLAVTTLTVASDYPLRWLFGITFGFGLFLSLLDEWLEWDRLVGYLLEPLTAEWWGFFPVMVGAMMDVASEADVPISGWGIATTLWILLLSAIVAIMASRHPDTLPRFRRPG